MIYTNFTSLREVQRNPKRIAEEVNSSNKPTIVISNNKPQFAIVSMKMVEELDKKERAKNNARALLELTKWAEKQNFTLPKDLSKNHDKYMWDR